MWIMDILIELLMIVGGVAVVLWGADKLTLGSVALAFSLFPNINTLNLLNSVVQNYFRNLSK